MPNTTAIVQRVTDLLTLAADPGAAPNEARNAAVVAAKLIAQHGMRVVEPCDSSAAATRSTARPPTPAATWRARSAAHEAWTGREGRAAREARERMEREAREARAEHERHERRRTERGHPWVAQEPSTCGSCAADIATGSNCFYGPFPKHEWRCSPCAMRNARRKRKRATGAA